MDNNILQETALALQKEWAVSIPDIISEEAILKLLAERVVKIIAQGPDVFFQLMYRLDISEKKLNSVMHDEHAADKIARLIYDRQLQKIQSRINNKSNRADTDPDLKW